MFYDLASIEELLPKYIQDQGLDPKKFKCINPTHDDHNPSASVFMTKTGRYMIKCFGCPSPGLYDIFDAAHYLEGLPAKHTPGWIKENANVLAARYGISLPGRLANESKIPEIFDKLLEQAAPFSTSSVWSSSSLPFTRPLESILPSSFNLDKFTQHLKQSGYDLLDLGNAGLVTREGEIPRFEAGDVLFPFYSKNGIITGFSIRKASGTPKYHSTPNNPLFEKGSYLYGLFFDIEPSRYVYLVEGQRDCLGLWSKGYQALALMGTSLTEAHLKLLERYGYKSIVICLDGDPPGQKATLKAIEAMISKGLLPEVVSLPDNLDPLDIVEAGREKELEKRIGAAKYYAQVVKYFSEETGKTEKDIIELLASCPHQITRERLCKQVAEVLNVSIEAVISDVETRRQQIVSQEREKVIQRARAAADQIAQQPDAAIASLQTAQQDIAEIQRTRDRSSNKTATKMIESIRAAEYSTEVLDLEFREKGLGLISRILNDNGLGWTRGGKLICLAGDEHTGKTTIMTQAADEALLDPDTCVIYLSTDDSTEELVPRFISALVMDPRFALIDAIGKKRLTEDGDEEWRQLILRKATDTVTSWLAEEKLTIIDSSETRLLGSMYGRIDILRKKHPDANVLLFVDNFHRCHDHPGMDENTRQDLLSSMAKDIAVIKKVSVWATVEYRKAKLNLYKRSNDDVAGSRSLKYIASVIFHLFNDVVLKDGKVDQCAFVFDHKGNLLPLVRLNIGKNKISGRLGQFYLELFPYNGFVRSCDQREAGRKIAERIRLLNGGDEDNDGEDENIS